MHFKARKSEIVKKEKREKKKELIMKYLKRMKQKQEGAIQENCKRKQNMKPCLEFLKF